MRPAKPKGDLPTEDVGRQRTERRAMSRALLGHPIWMCKLTFDASGRLMDEKGYIVVNHKRVREINID
jgi:hypothetical protein